MIDLSGPRPRSTPLPAASSPTSWSAWPTSTTTASPGVVIGYVPRDLPGLDLSDPRTIRYRNSARRLHPGQDESPTTCRTSRTCVSRAVPTASTSPSTTCGSRRRTRSRPTGSKTRGSRRSTAVPHHLRGGQRLGITTARMSTTDFRTFERHGTMLQPDQKDVVLFPRGERAVPRVHASDAGVVRSSAGLWLTESDDLTHWGGHRPVAEPATACGTRCGSARRSSRSQPGRLSRSTTAPTARTGTGWARCCSTATTRQGACPDHTTARRRRALRARRVPAGRRVPERARRPRRRSDPWFYGAADEYICAADLAIDDVLSSSPPSDLCCDSSGA